MRDDGIGIPDSDQGRVFDRGFQVEPGRGRGSGLGLWICAEIIKAHQGTLSVAGKLRKGSVSSFALPMGL